MKRYKIFLLGLFAAPAVEAQSIDSMTMGQLQSEVKTENGKLESPMEGTVTYGKLKMLSATDMSKWGVPAGNYSGITPIADDSFAVVDDKSVSGGFYVFHIEMDKRNGKILRVSRGAFHGSTVPKAEDNEDIVYIPAFRTFFITSEAESTVEEYTAEGVKTGRRLQMPAAFAHENIQPNGGFESLAYDNATGHFWMTTENPLLSDKDYRIGAKSLQVLRLQQFGSDLEPQGWWAYPMEAARLKTDGNIYTFGVPAVLSIGKGELLVMEREAYVPNGYIGAKTNIRIFRVKLQESARREDGTPLSSVPVSALLQKTEVAVFTTRLQITQLNWANYEGMCLGPRLQDSSPTLLLVSDSQGGYGNSLYHLKDYLKVIVLSKDFLP